MIRGTILIGTGIYIGFVAASKVLKLVKKLEEVREDVDRRSTARILNIQPGVDWSKERKEDFELTVLSRLGWDPEVHKISKRIQSEVRAEQDARN